MRQASIASHWLAWLGVLALLPTLACSHSPAWREAAPKVPPPPEPPASAWEARSSSRGYTIWRKNIQSDCLFEDHNYELELPDDPKKLSDITFSMSNLDVDFEDPNQYCQWGPEVDVMFINGRRLGVLTGDDGRWSINSWQLSPSQLVSGANSIRIDTDSIGHQCWCVGVGWIEVRARAGFAVSARTPGPDEVNRDFHAGAVDLTVTFSEAYDARTLNASTFKLEYRPGTGKWQQVAGTVERLAPERFRFRPQADLKDGVRYRATLVGGASGVKSQMGRALEEDEVWSFWTVPDLSVTDAFDYGSGSNCPPSAAPCPGLELAVFQVARNAAMVPGKRAVARLYLRWRSHPDVHPDEQARKLKVDASLTVDGTKYSVTGEVKRPDLYSADERRTASHTVNLYHTPQKGLAYAVEVVPRDQRNARPVRFTQALALGGFTGTPSLSWTYTTLLAGDWSSGAPAQARREGNNAMLLGAQYVLGRFPVTTVHFDRVLADLSIGYTFTGGTVTDRLCGTSREVACPRFWFISEKMAEHRCIAEKLRSMRVPGRQRAVIVPQSVCPAVGMPAFTAGTDIFFYLTGLFPGADDPFTGVPVAHEVGHLQGLEHRDDRSGIEGFNVMAGRNHSYVEARGSAYSLMAGGLEYPAGAENHWLHNLDYASLLGGLRAPAGPRPLEPSLIVSGYIDRTAGTAALDPALVREQPLDPPAASGPCQVELLDERNGVLALRHMTPGLVFQPLHSTPRGASAAPRASGQSAGPEPFSASLPWDDRGRSLRVGCDGNVLARWERSDRPPAADFEGLADGAILSGLVTLLWRGEDADSPDLAYQLQVSLDGGTTWIPLMPLGTETKFLLDTTRLPSGEHRLRLLVTDGFNTSQAERTVTFSQPLQVLGPLPPDGATGVELEPLLSVHFVSDVAPSTLFWGTFRVREDGGPGVAGEVAYEPSTRRATFRPVAPLRPGRRHIAEIDAGVRDVLGNTLGAPYRWSFTTGPDTRFPRVLRASPSEAEREVPLNALVQVTFDEPMRPGSLTPERFQVLDASGQPVAGEVTLLPDRKRALFTPSAPLAPRSEYTARVAAELLDDAGNPLAHPFVWTFTSGTESSPGLRIIGADDQPRDTSGEGLYDLLAISVDVEVLKPGCTCKLSARLVDRHGTLLDWASNPFVSLPPGVHTLTLYYGGGPIRSNGVDGPYIVDAVSLSRIEQPLQPVRRFRLHQTRAYEASSFYSVMTLGGLPDQLLEVGTSREDAFNLRDYTTHVDQPVSSLSYSLQSVSDPRVGVSIDADGNIDIHPTPGTEVESDITVVVQDRYGSFFQVTSTFHVSVQHPRPSRLLTAAEREVGPGQPLPIDVELVDQWNRRFTKEADVLFEATEGTVVPGRVSTSTGLASTVLSTSGLSNTAFVTIRAGAASALVRVRVRTPPGRVLFLAPARGLVGTDISFSATVEPTTAELPITFVWEAEEQPWVIHRDVPGLTDTAAFRWPRSGRRRVLVTAHNAAGKAVGEHFIEVVLPELHPIALHASTASEARPEQHLRGLHHGNGPGRFGWLSWTGTQTQEELALGLKPRGNSETYVNPRSPQDHDLSAGDWVVARGGVRNSRELREALDQLTRMDITVPVWDESGEEDGQTRYRVSGFACVRITDHHLAGVDRLSVIFRKRGGCAEP